MATKEMLMAQQQASDQWAFFQAKNIREHIDRNQKTILTLNLLEKDALKPEVRQRYEEELRQVTAAEGRYAAEKDEIEKEARHLEQERDLYRSKDPYFEYAEVLLAIAIVMSSIAILAYSRMALSMALVSAGLGTLLAANGFLLIVRLPFFTP
jgi:hypothetical protein